jgi:hypothetical protein
MIKFQDLITEGVLIMVSANEMRKYYQNREFDDQFPDGLADLIKESHLFAVVTDESIEELEIIFENEDYSLDDYILMGENNYLKVQKHDKIFLTDHASFTEVCDWHHGDYQAYRFPQVLSEIKIKSGFYRIKVYKNPYIEDEYSLKIKLLFEQTQEVDKEVISTNPLEVFMFSYIPD